MKRWNTSFRMTTTPTELKQELTENKLVQVLHNLPAGNWGAGERGIAVLPDRIDEFRRGVVMAIDYATALGCKQVNCLAGIAPAGLATMSCVPPSSII